MSANEHRLRKTLTPNDVGATGSHQAGIHVPKSVVSFFPRLDRSVLNPDAWLCVEVHGATHRWRFIHYNNGVVESGTRDEYRLTNVVKSLRAVGATAGDVLELIRDGDTTSYSCRLVQTEHDPGVLVLSTDGPWHLVQVRRRA
jgi:hypothetical protein